MDITEKKKHLRSVIRERKKLFDAADLQAASAKIFQQIETLPVFQSARTVLAYWSIKGEVYTHDFVRKWYKDKKIFLPIVAGNELELHQFTGMDCMVEGASFGILEPQKGPIASADEIDLALIPGVAFDNEANRMGRGKAYYDKLLASAEFFKIGVCFQFQMVEQVPVDAHDIPMDRVIHDSQLRG